MRAECVDPVETRSNGAQLSFRDAAKRQVAIHIPEAVFMDSGLRRCAAPRNDGVGLVAKRSLYFRP